jgi:hypothetical protein
VRGAADASGRTADVHGLRRVLLEMRARDADGLVAVGARNHERAAPAERDVVLGDLVALRVVRVEVVLAVEERVLGDLAPERVAEFDRVLDRLRVRHRERARVCEADRAGTRVRLRAVRERAAAEHLRPRLQVDVDLEPDDRFPVGHRSLSGT